MIRLLSSGALGALLCLSVFAAPWEPLDPAEFEQETSQIEPEAGAEILLRDIAISNDLSEGTTISYYLRIRVYNERGLEHVSKIDLPYARGTRISGLEARTVHPDGKVVVLDRKDVFDREVTKVGSYRERVRSFAPPALEPGVIVEYRYSHHFGEPLFLYVLNFQEELPARVVRQRIRPFSLPNLPLRYVAFNCPISDQKPDRDGYVTFERRDLRAWREEPFQPPPIHFRPTVVMYYRDSRDKDDPQKYWELLAGRRYRETASQSKPTRAIQATLQKILAPGDSDADKLRKIHEFCRKEIVHRVRVPAPAGKPYPENGDAGDTLKRGSGWPYDIDIMFMALARAAGFEARAALVNDRSFLLYDQRSNDPFYLSDFAVAVKVGDGWTYTSPGRAPDLPFGLLPWENTTTAVLVTAEKAAAVTSVPAVPSAASQCRRVGRFTLDQDGVLEGEVTLSYTGYLAARRRANAWDETETERADSLREEVKETLPGAELTDILFRNLDDPEEPLLITFRLTVPEYGERTGSRLFVQPAVFQKKRPALFSSADRRTDILFHYGFEEHDSIVITHAEGYSLEAGAAPAPVDMRGLGSYEPKLMYRPRTRELTYERSYVRDLVQVAQPKYALVKGIFDAVHAADQHVLTFRRAAAADAPVANTEQSVETATASGGS